MPATHHFTKAEKVSMRRQAWHKRGFVMVAYVGDLAGGTLKLSSVVHNIETPIPYGWLSSVNVDADNNPIQQVIIQSVGELFIELDLVVGTPDCVVLVE